MTREDLYKNICKDVIDLMMGVDKDELKSNVDYNIDDFLRLLTTPADRKKWYFGLLKTIKTDMARGIADEEINIDTHKYVVGTFGKNREKRNMLYADDHFGLFNLDDVDLRANLSETVWVKVYSLCNNDACRVPFLKMIKNGPFKNRYCIIYKDTAFNGSDPAASDKEKNNILSYCLFTAVNQQNMYRRSEELAKPTFSPTPLQYNPDVKYYQFNDIYDVISEWNMSDDLLSSFQRMYQILEYIAYRELVAAIVNKAELKQSFMRQIKNIADKYSKSERESFKKCIKESFDYDGKIVAADITPEIIAFCGTNFAPNKKGNPYMSAGITANKEELNSAIAYFIYDVRCSIVHNKESEFHMTLFNYDEYKPIKDLLVKVIQKTRGMIVDYLNNTSNNIIYNKDYLSLL